MMPLAYNHLCLTKQVQCMNDDKSQDDLQNSHQSSKYFTQVKRSEWNNEITTKRERGEKRKKKKKKKRFAEKLREMTPVCHIINSLLFSLIMSLSQTGRPIYLGILWAYDLFYKSETLTHDYMQTDKIN